VCVCVCVCVCVDFMVQNARITLACEVGYEKAKYHTPPNLQCVGNQKNIKMFNEISIVFYFSITIIDNHL